MRWSGARRWLARCAALLRSGRAESELAREIEAHLTLLEDELRGRGMSDDDARRAARLALGGVDQVKERQRDARTFRWAEDLRRDLAYAWRGLARSPGFATSTIVTLTLAVGVTSAVTATADAVLLRPLAFAPEPDQLVRVMVHVPDPARPDTPPRRREATLTTTEVATLTARAKSLVGAGLVSATIRGLPGVEGAGRLSGAYLSIDSLTLLSPATLVGRPLTVGDDGAVVLSTGAWQRYFGADPAVVGRALTVETVLGARRVESVTVVGVMAPTFTFPSEQTDFWMLPPVTPSSPFRGRVLARLRRGVTPEAAAVDVGEALREIQQLGANVRVELVREHDELVGATRPVLLALVAAVGVLLAIACLNVAGLFQARALARQHEFATRAAVGASRGRLLRQSLTESALIGALGGAFGLALASVLLSTVRSFSAGIGRFDLVIPAPLPRLHEIALSPLIVVATAFGGVAVGLLAGALAAIRASRPPALAGMRQRASATPAWHGRRLLVAVQVAGAVFLVVGAILTGTTFRNLLGVDAGYQRGHRLTFQVSFPSSRFADDQIASFAETFASRLGALPSITSVGFANQLPLVQLRDTGGGLWTTPDVTRRSTEESADARFVSRDYLPTMGIPLLRGRGFDDRDGAGQPRVVLVNQALAERQFAGRDPLGLHVFIGRDVEPWTVVGVVGNVRQFGLHQAPEPQFFVDLRQWAPGGAPRFPVGPYFVAATEVAPEEVIPALRGVLTSMAPEARLFNLASMDTLVTASIARPRLLATILTSLSTVGVALAVVGLYGVLSYVTAARRREFGVRLALGATPRDVLGVVICQGALVVVSGLAAGVAGTLMLGGVIESALFGVTTRDPLVFAMAALGVGLAASVGIWLPARRATRVDAVEVLRCE